ncbi:unnamed protein product, partial [Prorocentrum cordatum]
MPLVVGTLDIKTAFETMRHGHVSRILLNKGLHPNLVRAMLREMSILFCSMVLPGMLASDSFPLEVGGKQGGVETLELFNCMVEFVLEPLVPSWRSRNFGILFDARCPPLTHLIWADNFILFASSVQQFQTMAQELTTALAEIEFRWKPASMECMVCGSLIDELVQTPLITEPGAETPLTFSLVSHLVLLGGFITARAETM